MPLSCSAPLQQWSVGGRRLSDISRPLERIGCERRSISLVILQYLILQCLLHCTEPSLVFGTVLQSSRQRRKKGTSQPWEEFEFGAPAELTPAPSIEPIACDSRQ